MRNAAASGAPLFSWHACIQILFARGLGILACEQATMCDVLVVGRLDDALDVDVIVTCVNVAQGNSTHWMSTGLFWRTAYMLASTVMVLPRVP